MLFVLGVSSTRGQVQIASCMGFKTAGAQGEKGDPEIRLTVFTDFFRRNGFFFCWDDVISNSFLEKTRAPILRDISLRFWLAS